MTTFHFNAASAHHQAHMQAKRPANNAPVDVRQFIPSGTGDLDKAKFHYAIQLASRSQTSSRAGSPLTANGRNTRAKI